MPDDARTHAALFDELERQGIFCVDVGKLTRAVFDAHVVISDAEPRSAGSCNAWSYQRCENCE